MIYRELILLEWTVIDNCNLNCSYCVNKGQYTHKPKDRILYVPGREVMVAEKIIQLSEYAEHIKIHLTGGEPLMADNIIKVFSLLTRSPKISITLITNLRQITELENHIVPFLRFFTIHGSIHIKFRTDEEINKIVSFINNYQEFLTLSLTQVDYELTENDRARLNEISEQTGLEIVFEPYIHPYSKKDGNLDDLSKSQRLGVKLEEITEKGEVKATHPLAKRCCLGYSHFLVLPDGNFYYDLWCHSEAYKEGDFLTLTSSNINDYMLDEMKKCPYAYCPCNHNLFHYDYYLRACKRLGYPEHEIFQP